MTTYTMLRDLLRAGARPDDLRSRWWNDTIRAIGWRDAERLAAKYPEEWPLCECACGPCDAPAVRVDYDSDDLICIDCEYTVDHTASDDGELLCGHCDADRVETVVESCGAGLQARSYLRRRPPAMPAPDGE